MIDYKDINYAISLIKIYSRDSIREAERLEVFLENNVDYKDTLSKLITTCENAALVARKLTAVPKIKDDIVTEMDILDNIDVPKECTLIYDSLYDGYVMTLPPLNGKKHALKRHGDTGYIRSLALALIRQFNGDIKQVDNPVLVFEHHINKDDNLMRYMDADNIDVKRVTDTLQGSFIKDDNTLSLSIIHFGVLDKSSFCKLNILPKTTLMQWLSDHENLLK